MAKSEVKKEESMEETLWDSVNKLRKNMDAAEYKHIVLGLVFLKYISDNFTELYNKLKSGEGEYEGADPDDLEVYRAENVFYVPIKARWKYLQSKMKSSRIDKVIYDAMDEIEKNNPSLEDVFPKEYAKEKLDKQSLSELIDKIGTIALGDSISKSNDILGRVYEYLVGQFALAEGKKGGQFYTPRTVVQLLVEMIEPYEGRVFDPCCGSGGMFVQIEKFIKANSDHYNGNIKEFDKLFKRMVSIYGQESNQTTWQLCKMNLAMWGIDSSNIKWSNEGSFLNDVHPDLKADFIFADPPFNDKVWGGILLRKDKRWAFGAPPVNNANFAWIQYFLYHLAPGGTAGFIMHCSAASNKSQIEIDIRKRILDAGLLKCVVALPTQLFTNTTLPVHIWILSRQESSSNDVLMIDAYDMGFMQESTQRILLQEDIDKIVGAYSLWKNNEIRYPYEDIGFCKIVSYEEIKEKNFIFAPNRYVKRKEVIHHNFEEDFNLDELVNIRKYNETIKTYSDKLGLLGDGFYNRYKSCVLSEKETEWDKIELFEVIEDIISGEWGDEIKKKETLPCKILRGTDLSNVPLFNLAKIPTRFLKSDKIEAKSLESGDIVVEMSGGGKDQPTGRTALITDELIEWFDLPILCSNFCKVIRPNKDKVEPLWLYLYFQLAYSDGLTTRYENQRSGIKNFQLDEFLNSELILLPDLPEQRKALSSMDTLFKIKNSMSAEAQKFNKIIATSFENIYKR